jgi:hypothetical protein
MRTAAARHQQQFGIGNLLRRNGQHHNLDERDRDQVVERSIKGHLTSSLAPGLVRGHTRTQRGAELARQREALVQVPGMLANDERSARLDAFAVKRLRINSMLQRQSFAKNPK